CVMRAARAAAEVARALQNGEGVARELRPLGQVQALVGARLGGARPARGLVQVARALPVAPPVAAPEAHGLTETAGRAPFATASVEKRLGFDGDQDRPDGGPAA